MKNKEKHFSRKRKPTEQQQKATQPNTVGFSKGYSENRGFSLAVKTRGLIVFATHFFSAY
jgi:hypothetical protein